MKSIARLAADCTWQHFQGGPPRRGRYEAKDETNCAQAFAQRP